MTDVTRGSRAWKHPPSCSLPGCAEFTRLPSHCSEGQGWSSHQTNDRCPLRTSAATAPWETPFSPRQCL